jgi:hypothetical protein
MKLTAFSFNLGLWYSHMLSFLSLNLCAGLMPSNNMAKEQQQCTNTNKYFTGTSFVTFISLTSGWWKECFSYHCEKMCPCRDLAENILLEIQLWNWIYFYIISLPAKQWNCSITTTVHMLNGYGCTTGLTIPWLHRSS